MKESTQKTPKGAEIPIPTRGEFFRNLAQTAKPQKDKLAPRRPKKK